MRVISLNAWGGKLYEPLIRYLRDADPDVLCLQEVTRSVGVTSDWLEYRDGSHILPQRANLFDEIKAILPHHDAFFAPTARGTLFDGEQQLSSEFGLATFVRNSYPVVGHAMDFVHGDFSGDGYGEHPRPRNAHCIRLFDYSANRPITIVQLHGLRDLAGKGDTAARGGQADALVALIHRIWREGEPLVVCGDFNVVPGSVMFAALAELGLTDLVTSRGHTDTRTSHYAKEGRYADYLLVTANIDVVAFDVVEQPEVSDHRALLLEIA
ncbi:MULTISPECIES: endonuclease/exonuclease/phosphatase family protein [unclassified Rhizobium]|uniref:endonuclease/exonuclease/phosphatase family protein n=1 Tax=unclassified Rhizobium TaxID=2613769 RepID=UPI001612E8F1|nr:MULTISPECIES: endonuclease/exonuclease/phosphatase family protein [unclassified Rhizobium]MBB3539966.1 endonuclease/exonuclease/phosphatase family metal-dependent hydrolase [Rhizobium sp. BK399]MCS3739024.1 endonuclease/exonuclease/phosphatase family metal-dependent hydrolase [Rhizobium sp. BK661]MCS4090651.1 endonuclease/exonuclease/phosphatase family metal-dependent hydrolase [Rhizobium sp. BK176]